MAFTKRISIERYKHPTEGGYAGCIEGETDDGDRWILWVDENGRPEVYWPNREEDGAVVGNAVKLNLKHPYPGVYESLAPKDGEEIVATFPVWEDGMRGILFGIVPSDTSIDEREALPWAQISRLLNRLQHEWMTGKPKDGWGDFDQACASRFEEGEPTSQSPSPETSSSA